MLFALVFDGGCCGCGYGGPKGRLSPHNAHTERRAPRGFLPEVVIGDREHQLPLCCCSSTSRVDLVPKSMDVPGKCLTFT